MKHQYIRQKNIRQKIKWMLVLLMAVSLSACGVKEEKNRQQAEENSAEESISKDGTYEIAFISGEGELDDSGFHESSWFQDDLPQGGQILLHPQKKRFHRLP